MVLSGMLLDSLLEMIRSSLFAIILCAEFLDWFHQEGPTQRWSEAMDSIVAKESSNPNLSVSQEGEWNVSVFISFWTLPCLVQAYFLLKV